MFDYGASHLVGDEGQTFQARLAAPFHAIDSPCPGDAASNRSVGYKCRCVADNSQQQSVQ